MTPTNRIPSLPWALSRVLLTATVLLLSWTCVPVAASVSPYDAVDPFVGTGGKGYGAGSMFPGAQVPFGFVRVSPDTFDALDFPWQHFGGYDYDDHVIAAISHTHMVGAGASGLGDLSVMPLSGKRLSQPDIQPGAMGWMSTFSHDRESAAPGYYRVTLDQGNVGVELTATRQTALHRYTFDAAAGGPNQVVFDVGYTLVPDGCAEARWSLDAAGGGLSGTLVDRGGLSGRFGGLALSWDVRFVAATTTTTTTTSSTRTTADAPVMPAAAAVASWGYWVNGTLHTDAPPDAATVSGCASGAVATLHPNVTSVEVSVALSLINVTQARANAAAQQGPEPGFDAVWAQARQTWTQLLSTLAIDSPSTPRDTVRMAYTMLYQSALAPTNYAEAGGAYRSFGEPALRVEHAANDMAFSDMSLWDVHRTQLPFLGLWQPHVLDGVVRSLVAMYAQGGDLPRWPLANGYTECMIANHALVVLADAIVKNVTTDARVVQAAYRGMRQYATEPQAHAGRQHLAQWLSLGYVPYNVDAHAAVKTLAYAFDDWALSQVARVLGLANDTAVFAQRALNYRNTWDPEKRFFCPRNEDGTFECPLVFDNPFDRRYVEGDAWQYRFFVPHDPLGLIALFGSNDSFVHELSNFMTLGRIDPDTVLPNPYYWAGNEPDIMSPWLFNWAQRQDLTQEHTRWVQQHRYSLTPQGLGGNSDYGAISNWYLLSALGLYPQAGSTVWALGSPSFSNVTLSRPDPLPDVSIVVHGFDPTQPLLAPKLLVNGEPSPWGSGFVDHTVFNDVTRGVVTLEFFAMP